MRRACLAAAVALAALAGAAATNADSLPTLQPVALPRDHGAHPAFQIEWWYTAGTVTAPGGRDFFWFATVWTGEGFRLAKVNVVDLRADRIVLSREYVASGALRPGQTRINVGGFALGWRPTGRFGRWSIAAAVPGAGELQLSLTPIHPYVLNGTDGIVQEGPGATSAYYSDPRLSAHGTLLLGSDRIAIAGQGWFDHQWGNFLTNTASWHWNWFACQFTKGSDLMLYQFITPAGQPTGVQSGTYVPIHGPVTHPSNFTVTPLPPTIHPAGATATYPLRWRVDVPAAHLDLTLKSRARHQFITNQYLPSFWEGASTITSGTPGTCIVESTREPASEF
ncbi:MAG TPA: lipocalin-like domain-containing protein [Solirubrobacteraceae bacterium]|nr:lipocalin-like domain-containing protein [Solirubrobacteraceae bacterium]